MQIYCSVPKLLAIIRSFSITVHASLFARWQQVCMRPSLVWTATTYLSGVSLGRLAVASQRMNKYNPMCQETRAEPFQKTSVNAL